MKDIYIYIIAFTIVIIIIFFTIKSIKKDNKTDSVMVNKLSGATVYLRQPIPSTLEEDMYEYYPTLTKLKYKDKIGVIKLHKDISGNEYIEFQPGKFILKSSTNYNKLINNKEYTEMQLQNV